MVHFSCTCGNTLFFENAICLKCSSAVGYDLVENDMHPITEEYVQCKNGADFGVCNWLVAAGGNAYCTACALNHMVPDLSVPENQDAWHKMEAAKRRVIYTLARLNIVPPDRRQQPDGLAFDFLTTLPGQCVMTGHKEGVITLNLSEADDLYREQQRHQLGEPYRTLVGHFRHEVGHYYWDRFFLQRGVDDPLLVEYRNLFGDEREDYGAALARYYEKGPASSWSTTHITGYATAHPWEDWAETWAQYLHIVDGVETAAAFGWASQNVPIPFTPLLPEQVLADTPDADDSFLSTLNDWAKLSPALNEMSASLGHATMYPFIFTPLTARKILFIHQMVKVAAQTWGQQVTAPPPPVTEPTPPVTSPAPPSTMPTQTAVKPSTVTAAA